MTGIILPVPYAVLSAPRPHEDVIVSRRTVLVLRSLLLVVVAGGSAAVFGRETLLFGIADMLTVEDQPMQADHLVVLGGDPETRPFKAAELFRLGYAPSVLIFEQPIRRLPEETFLPPSEELYRQVLIRQGVPAEAIHVVAGPVTSTWEEGRALRDYLCLHPAQGILVITSPEHTRRARWILRSFLAESGVDVRIVGAPSLDFDESDWWRDDEGVLAYLHEYLKVPLTLARRLLSRGVPQSAASSLCPPRAEGTEAKG